MYYFFPFSVGLNIKLRDFNTDSDKNRSWLKECDNHKMQQYSKKEL